MLLDNSILAGRKPGKKVKVINLTKASNGKTKNISRAEVSGKGQMQKG